MLWCNISYCVIMETQQLRFHFTLQMAVILLWVWGSRDWCYCIKPNLLLFFFSAIDVNQRVQVFLFLVIPHTQIFPKAWMVCGLANVKSLYQEIKLPFHDIITSSANSTMKLIDNTPLSVLLWFDVLMPFIMIVFCLLPIFCLKSIFVD